MESACERERTVCCCRVSGVTWLEYSVDIDNHERLRAEKRVRESAGAVQLVSETRDHELSRHQDRRVR